MPDNFIQQPENTQNYNRYAYVLNNPLMYTDPSGELFGLDDLAAAIIIGAVIAATTYTMTALLADVPFTVGGLAKATFVGAATAAVTFGIGSASSSLFTNFFSKAAFQAVAHGTFQGTMSGLQGGNFWTGFAAGALSSIAASAWSGGSSMDGLGKNAHAISGTGMKGIGGSFANSGAGMVAFGTVSGGAGAALTGGNFWQGAVIGLVVSGLNHLGHQEQKMKLTRVINSTEEAFDHYYNGFDGEKGVSAVIGDETVSELIGSDKFQEKYNRIVKGIGNGEVTSKKGSFSIDLTTKTFHVGRTNVNYSVKVLSSGKINVTFQLFVKDGFWDPNVLYEKAGIQTPDGMGPNLEFKGGTPYYYNAKILNYNNLPNPGYKK